MTDFRINQARFLGLTPDEAAAHWLVARDRGFSPSEESRFAAWLGNSERHAVAWARAERLWASFEARPDDLLEAMRVAALQARPGAEPHYRRRLIAASAAAAMVLAGLSGWQWLAMRSDGSGRAPRLAAAASRSNYATAMGGRSNIVLSDGTLVSLDSATAVQVDYTAASRNIHLLSGQAYFSVAHDVRHPFVVEAAGNTVTALGTAFNVCIGPRAMTVVVAKGSVLVSQAREMARGVRLSSGQAFRAAAGEPGVVRPVDVDQMLAWRLGYLDFRNEPLADAVTEMNQHGGPPLSVGDAAAGSLKVSGRFRTGDPARFARALAQVYPLRIDRSGDHIIIIHR